MASHWRGYRPLVVGDRRYQWACDFHDRSELESVGYKLRGEAWPPDRLVVRPEDGPHRLLTVTWPACRGPVVTPGYVRRCVEEAVRRGWPETRSGLELSGTDLPNVSAREDEGGVGPDQP